MHALFRRHERDEIKFNFIRIGLCCETQSLGEPHDVRIDADRGLAKDVAEKDVRRFSAYPRQRQKIR